MDALLTNVRYSIRMLLKKPGLTAVILITLALGIGANTTIFSVVYPALLAPLPYPQPERLFTLAENRPQKGCCFLPLPILTISIGNGPQRAFSPSLVFSRSLLLWREWESPEEFLPLRSRRIFSQL
jgi:hypothetical protein